MWDRFLKYLGIRKRNVDYTGPHYQLTLAAEIMSASILPDYAVIRVQLDGSGDTLSFKVESCLLEAFRPGMKFKFLSDVKPAAKR